MSQMKGKIVLITGVGAGNVGFMTAREFGRAGSKLIITNVNEETLKQAAEALAKDNVEVHTYVIDVSNKEQVEAMASDVIKKFGRVDILINNAGVGHTGEFIVTDYRIWERLFNVNFWGQMYHIYAFLPHMIKRGDGQIVNVSTGQAYFRIPTWGAYTTSKIALGAFSEILHYELRDFGITVTTVYPFMIRNTEFYKDMKARSWGIKMFMKYLHLYSSTPEAVGKKIYKAAVKKKRVERIYYLNWIGKYIHFNIPFVYNTVSQIAYQVLGRPPEQLGGKKMRWSRTRRLATMLDERRVGFEIDEIMTGEHEFEKGFGPSGKKSMEFRATWGPKHISQFFNPRSNKFCVGELEGTVTIEGLCTDVPIRGTLTLSYFREHKLRYIFDFSVNSKGYHFVGEKINVRLWRFWELPKTHTTCYGKLTLADTSELVSKSITYFRFRTSLRFIRSFRLA
jgi:NAD(P)-dependent dehydrogenase (short-subunit alcohol dehydrogenase family)